MRLPLPATCLDCGADVLACADIEGPFPPDRPSFNALRIRRATMTLCFIVGRILRELIELAKRDADAELVDALHNALDVAARP